jgi:hypothetical protein
MNEYLDLLLSALNTRDPLVPKQLADLRRSELADDTVWLHRFRSAPQHIIARLLASDPRQVRSAMLIPFPDSATGGFTGHIRLTVFPSFKNRTGNAVKCLQRRRSGARLYFPLLHLPAKNSRRAQLERPTVVRSPRLAGRDGDNPQKGGA